MLFTGEFGFVEVAEVFETGVYEYAQQPPKDENQC